MTKLQNVRIGRLRLISRFLRKSDQWCVAVLFQCDCGKLVKVSTKKILAKKVPEACTDCLKYIYPREYQTWKWIENKRRKAWTFSRFITDMGFCPPGYKISRKNPKRQHGPKNSYWKPK